MSIIQNILFGFVVSLFQCQCNFEVIKGIFASIKYQTVILSDSPIFRNRYSACSKWMVFVSLLTGYFAYLFPASGLTGFLIFFQTNSIVCFPLEATFLFNNSASLSLNTTFTDLYQDRKGHGGMVTNLWKRKEDEGYKILEMPLNNLTDFIAQFNYVGYHDICNYPEKNELFEYSELDRSENPKGFKYNYPGYIWKNTSGSGYKYYQCFKSGMIFHPVPYRSRMA